MGRPNRASSKRGPDDERMWRRLTSLFKSESDWNKSWSVDDIVNYLVENESRPPTREDEKAYQKRLRTIVEEIVRNARKHGSHFKWDGNNMVTARSREVIVEIEQSVADWSTRLSQLEKEPLTNSEKWFEILIAIKALLLQTSLPESVRPRDRSRSLR